MTLRNFTYLCIVLLFVPLQAKAQYYPAIQHVYLTSGESYNAEIQSFANISVKPDLNCVVDGGITNNGNATYGFNMHAIDPNFLGETGVIVEYLVFTPPFNIKPFYTRIILHYSVSVLHAQDDYVTFTGETDVLPLNNDTTTGDSLWLENVAYVKYGQAEISGDTIHYLPVDGQDEDVIMYSVKDMEGNSTKATIYLQRESSLTENDTTHLYVERYRKLNLSRPSQDFTLTIQPSHGNLTSLSSLKYLYSPTASSVIDTVQFSNGNYIDKTYLIHVFEIPENVSSVIDDHIYTAVNNAVTFDVFANDLANKYSISAFSSQLQHDTLGVFSYTPPVNFSGVKNFSYTVNFGYYSATGKISIHIGNYAPRENVQYNIHTKINTSGFLTYDIPLENYSFTVSASPAYGSASVQLSQDSIAAECNAITSRAIISYTPDAGYYGDDEFDITYCVDSLQCETYKIYVHIYNTSDTDCVCEGKDCVWQGDLNNDGIVSVNDLLVLGRNFGFAGPISEQSNQNFPHGRFSDDWLPSPYATADMKYVDADGNGHIDFNDLDEITNNYGESHNLVPDEVLAIKEYPFYMTSNASTVDSGDLLIIKYHIGTPSSIVKSFHGMAFAVKLAPNFVDSSSFESHFYEDAWFQAREASLQMAVQPSDGVIHMGVTRIDGKEVSGFGEVGESSYIVTDELEGIKTQADFIMRRITATDIVLMDDEGQLVRVPNAYIDIRQNIKKSEPVPSEDKLFIYPNPTSDGINLHFNGRNTIKGYRIFDMQGRIAVNVSDVDSQHAIISTDNFSNGMYIIQAYTTLGTIQKKIEVIK